MTPKDMRPTGFIRRLMKAQDGECFHCDEPMLLRPDIGPADRFANREHVFPHATTGKGMVYNIVLAHYGCNIDRKDRQPSAAEIAKAARIYKILGIIPFVAAEKSGIVFTPSRQKAAR
jgi:hypothetical protein